MENTYQSENFYIEIFERNTNEILINCIGTKYPTLELQNLFTELEIESDHGIKLLSCFDGDGDDEYFYIVNGSSCSRQKYSAFHRKFKVLDSKAKRKIKENTKKSLSPPQKRIPKDNSPSEKQLNLINSFNYGGDGKENSCLIRLMIRSKPKREIVRNLFNKHINLNESGDITEFSNEFKNIITPNTLSLNWCSYRDLRSDTLCTAPAELIRGLAFIVEENNYLYLGFKLDKLGFTTGTEVDLVYEHLGLTTKRSVDKAFENLIIILDSIEGVNRTWIKCRLGKSLTQERYIFYPNGGRDPEVLRKKSSEDYEWPSSR